MTQAVLETEGLSVRFGGHVAVDNVTSTFHAGELTAIVGPNGAGKTTYFNLISGQIPASSGRVKLLGEDITRNSVADRCHKGLGRAFQLTNLFPDLTVQENVRLVVQAHRNRGFCQLNMRDQSLLQCSEVVFRVFEIRQECQIVHLDWTRMLSIYFFAIW